MKTNQLVCIKKLRLDTGRVAFRKGYVYNIQHDFQIKCPIKCLPDEALMIITNEQGHAHHIGRDFFIKHFIRLKNRK